MRNRHSEQSDAKQAETGRAEISKLEAGPPDGPFSRGLKQLIAFGMQQALSCVFPVAIFAALALSKSVALPFLHRYDVVLLICLAVQAVMFASGMETKDELKVITVFHLIGLALELYKVHMGSWSYPETAWTKVYGVPLYSGFMYASVASYICQAWRRFDLRLAGWPKAYYSVPLAAAIYINFFTHHYVIDLRWLLSVLLVIVFAKTFVSFRVNTRILRMPLVLSFALIGFFIWIAENISTFMGAWTYPEQERSWHVVHVGKISSWFLLVVISIVIVAQLKHVKRQIRPEAAADKTYSRDGVDVGG